MNGYRDLDDLRAALHDEAEQVHPVSTAERGDAVHARVRRVRRRRQAAVALATVVVVGLGLAGLVWPSTRTPAPADPPPRLLGVQAPATLQALGWTYGYDRAATGDGEARLDVQAHQPVLLTWTSTDDAPVVVSSSLLTTVRSATDGFRDWTVVDPDRDGTVRVRADGPVALAAYTVAKAAPGYSRDGIVYRDQVGDDTLRAAAVGEPGQHSVVLRTTMPRGGLLIATACSGGGADQRVTTRFGGERGSTTFGCGDASFDPGARGGATLYPGKGRRPGSPVEVTVSTPSSSSSQQRLSAAAYAVAPPALKLLGMDLPRHTEWGGHLWELDRWRTGAGADGPRPLRVSQPSLVSLVVSGRCPAQAGLTVDGKASSSDPAAGDITQVAMSGGGMVTGGVLQPGHEVGARLVGRRAGQCQVAVVTATRVPGR